MNILFYTMNLSERSYDKELFSGEQSSKENTVKIYIFQLFIYRFFLSFAFQKNILDTQFNIYI